MAINAVALQRSTDRAIYRNISVAVVLFTVALVTRCDH
jgi:hypothetical protein